MNRSHAILFILTLLAVAVFTNATAQMPRTLNYQGTLATGPTPVPDGNYNVTFRLYTASSGGSAIWTEAQLVSARNGVFNATLGKIVSLPASFNLSYWMSLQVGADPELAPRLEMTGVAYSMRSLVADSAVKIADGAVGNLKISNDAVTTDKILDGTIAAADLSAELKSRYTTLANLNLATVSIGATWTKLNIGTRTFTKALADTKIELYFNSRISVGAITGYGPMFELRVDDLETTIQSRGVVFTSSSDDWITMLAVFDGLAAGTHSVSVWAYATGSGSVTDIIIDRGGFGGSIVVKECR